MGVEKRGWETGYLMGQEPRETGNKFHNIMHFFATEKAHRSRRKKLRKGMGTGRTRYGKQEMQTSLLPAKR